MTDHGDPFPITLRPTGDGCFRVEFPADQFADLAPLWEKLNELPGDMREAAEEVGQDPEAVRFGSVVWAGPYEIYMAIAGGGVGVGALMTGAAALLNVFVRKNPDQPVTIVFNDQSSYTITGQPIPDDIAAKIDALAAENSTPPAELETPPETHAGPAGSRPRPDEFPPPG